MQSDERLKQKQCKGEEGRKEGEENEKLVPVTAFLEELSISFSVRKDQQSWSFTLAMNSTSLAYTHNSQLQIL